MSLKTEGIRVGGQRGFSKGACILMLTLLKKKRKYHTPKCLYHMKHDHGQRSANNNFYINVNKSLHCGMQLSHPSDLILSCIITMYQDVFLLQKHKLTTCSHSHLADRNWPLLKIEKGFSHN